MSDRIGATQQKILLLFLGGLALGLSGSPRRYFRILKMIGKEWREIDRRVLRESIRRLYQRRLIEEKHNTDGTITLLLSEEGRKRALIFKLDEMEIKRPKRWDRKWQIVIFDVPERKKKLRDILRWRLRQLHFRELQKSVFVHPFPCKDEVDFLVELYGLRPFVRLISADWIDNEFHLRQKFGLS